MEDAAHYASWTTAAKAATKEKTIPSWPEFFCNPAAPLSEIVLVFRSVSTDAANNCVARLVFSTSGFHPLFATKAGRRRCALFAPGSRRVPT